MRSASRLERGSVPGGYAAAAALVASALAGQVLLRRSCACGAVAL